MATRNESYRRLMEEGIENRQREVLAVIDQFGPINNRQISRVLERPINTITPRTRELVEMGLVEMADKAWDMVTGRNVMRWRVR